MKDTRQYKVMVLDEKETPYKLHTVTGAVSLVEQIEKCVADHDANPVMPFILRIERIGVRLFGGM